LLQRYRQGTASAEEQQLVEAWCQELERTGEQYTADLLSPPQSGEPGWGPEIGGGTDLEKWAALFESRMQAAIGKEPQTEASVISFSSSSPVGGGQVGAGAYPFWRRWRSVAAAACIIGMAGLGVYFWSLQHKVAAGGHPVIEASIADVKAPVTNRAMITLSGGQKVYLDSAANGTLATQGKTNIVKTADGVIAYEGEKESKSDLVIQYNTLDNPRGSKVIRIALPDGSNVWLNAASSLTYPTEFNGKERKVTITGEAYFEVAHDATRPFIVSKGATAVQVLGTHFNVNAYDDESVIKVTLLEGSVKVSLDATPEGVKRSTTKSAVIRPGDQAQVGTTISLFTGVDTDEVIAWKNGRFQFAGASIEEVMGQISRWYDVDIEYQAKPKEQHFAGGISRDVNVSNVFKILESTETMHFEIEGKKVIVLP